MNPAFQQPLPVFIAPQGPTADALSQAQFNALLGATPALAQTPAELAAGVTPVNYAYAPGDPRRYGADPTGVVDASTALQNCIAANTTVTLPSIAIFKFSTGLTINQRQYLFQGGGDRSVLVYTGAGAAITCLDTSLTLYPGGGAAYVEDGNFVLQNFTLYTAGHGIDLSKNRTSESIVSSVYIRSYTYYSSLTSSNIAIATNGQRAITIDNTTWSGTTSTYAITIRECTFVGFQNAIYLDQTVNFIYIEHVYAIDCFVLLNISPTTGTAPGVNGVYMMATYDESGIAGSQGVLFGIGGGNNITLQHCNWELTNAAATQFAYNFTAGGTWGQITVVAGKYLLQGDGNAINSKRITGTAPPTFVEVNRTYQTAGAGNGVYGTIPMIWQPAGSVAAPTALPAFARHGGNAQGAGTLYFGRNDTDAADSMIGTDATGNLNIQGYAAVNIGIGVSAIGITFTGAPTGTSATLTANWAYPTNAYLVTFSDLETRSVTLTNGATTATWTGALTGAPTTTAQVNGILQNFKLGMNSSGQFYANAQATTGAQTATFTATNKPGSGTTAPDKWLPIVLDGATHYIPCWT